MSDTTAYVPQTWVDHQQDPVTGEVLVQGTSMDAEHFNHIEAGVAAADTVARAAASGLVDKAPADHAHDSRYYTEAEMDTLLQGKAGSAHTHSPNDLTSAVPVSKGGTGAATAAEARAALGVAYGTAAGTVCQGNDSRLSNARTPTAHNQAASTITAGTLPAGVVATNSTDYGTSRLRTIKASTTDLTAGTSALNNGELYLVYE